MIINRDKVIERLKAGEILRESGNTMVFKDGNWCSAATDIYLRERGLVKITGRIGRRAYSWPN